MKPTHQRTPKGSPVPFPSTSSLAARVSLLTLDKYLPKVLEIWGELIFSPAFDNDDLKRISALTAQKLRHQLSKTACTRGARAGNIQF